MIFPFPCHGKTWYTAPMLPSSPVMDDSTLPIAISAASVDGESGGSYLVVFEELWSRLRPLPPAGSVIIGRGADADIRLSYTGVSRCHARLHVTSEEILLIDEQSQNGTFLNGERISGARRLTSGDVISIGGITLVFHRAPAPLRPAIGAPEGMHLRLTAEIDRCARYQRTLALLALRCDGASPDVLADAIESLLRPMDVAAWDDSSGVLVLLPEAHAAEATDAAARMLRALSAAGVAARCGCSSYPEDAADADSLLACARARATAVPASSSAPPRHQIAGMDLIVTEPVMEHTYQLLHRCARAEVPLLLRGEPGVGKTTAARIVHALSPRKDGPFVVLHCASLEADNESAASLAALLREARGGTLYLAEVDELSLPLQARLLSLLEAGGRQDVRLISATQADLGDVVCRGALRRALYDRLGGYPIVLPPLRERQRELPLLAEAFLREACTRLRRPAMDLDGEALARLRRHDWPGNLRQLRGLMDFLAVSVTELRVMPWHLPLEWQDQAPPQAAGACLPPGPAQAEPVASHVFRRLDEETRELTRLRMRQALGATGGVMVRAAQLLGKSERWFREEMKRMAEEEGRQQR